MSTMNESSSFLSTTHRIRKVIYRYTPDDGLISMAYKALVDLNKKIYPSNPIQKWRLKNEQTLPQRRYID